MTGIAITAVVDAAVCMDWCCHYGSNCLFKFEFCWINLGDKKNGGFLKQILSISIQEKLIKIGDGKKALQKIFNLSCIWKF